MSVGLPLSWITIISKTGSPPRIFSLTDKIAPCAEAFWMIVGILTLVIDSGA